MEFGSYVASVAGSLSRLHTEQLAVQIESTARALVRARHCWATGLGKSARAASLFAEDLATLTLAGAFIHGGDLLHGGVGCIGQEDCVVFFSDRGNASELVAASRLVLTRTRILITSSDDPQIMADHTIRYTSVWQHPYGLPSATVIQTILGRYLAISAARHAGIKPASIGWAHPA